MRGNLLWAHLKYYAISQDNISDWQANVLLL